MTWEDWKKQYQKQLDHPAGFEEEFVNKVLSRIQEISPEDVVPQYHFTDSTGRNRRIDFMIKNAEKNWLIPIELDGYRKMVGNGDDYERFNDFLLRQNSLIRTFGLVLRYSNKMMFNQANDIINEIKQLLYLQTNKKDTYDIKNIHINRLLKEYQSAFEILQKLLLKIENQSNDKDKKHAELSNNIESLGKSLNVLTDEIKLIEEKVENSKSKQERIIINNKNIKIISSLILLIIIIVSYISYNIKQNDNFTIDNHQQLSVQSEKSEKNDNIYTKSKHVELNYSDRNQKNIKSKNATRYIIGKTMNICGIVSEANTFKSGTYLNLNGKYPNQEITLVVWRQNDLKTYVGKFVCVYGKVENYRNNLFVNVNNLKAIKIK